MSQRFIYSILMLVCSLGAMPSQAQTYADDVATILFENCTSCHRQGGVAPMSLMTYSEVLPYVSTIQLEVNNKTMPPWPPNDNYQQYVHSRSLTAAEITTIDNWVNAGSPEGNPANTPAAPVYSSGAQLGTPDISVRIPNYVSKATASNDDYVCISIPMPSLTSTRTIKAIEILPGDPSIVHHALIYADLTGNYQTDTSSHNCAGPVGASIPLVAGYAPGGTPTQFPNTTGLKMGVQVTPGANLVFAMHYPEGSQGKLDSTRVNLHFYPLGTSGVRTVSASPLLNNFSFVINANNIDSVEGFYPGSNGLSSAYSLFSVFPHTHLLGKSFIVYAVNTVAPFDQIPLIHIPKWDFEWQDFYVFKNLIKVPAGYRLYGKAVYDNTTNNPFNPNNPPQNVGFGLNTTDEMFIVYFQFMPYQTGDETFNIDSLLTAQMPTGLEPIATNTNGLFLSSYPNPSKESITIQYYSADQEEVQLMIYDLQGRLVRQLIQSQTLKGEQITTWDGTNDAGQLVPPGVYITQLQTGSKILSHKLICH